MVMNIGQISTWFDLLLEEMTSRAGPSQRAADAAMDEAGKAHRPLAHLQDPATVRLRAFPLLTYSSCLMADTRNPMNRVADSLKMRLVMGKRTCLAVRNVPPCRFFPTPASI